MDYIKTFEMKEDLLLAGPEVTSLLKNVEITAGTVMKRGTLLSFTDGKAAACAKGGEAAYVLARDVDETATVATAYSQGYFNREALIAADGDTVGAHEEELRKVNIILTSVK
jgi:hypothetical protein